MKRIIFWMVMAVIGAIFLAFNVFADGMFEVKGYESKKYSVDNQKAVQIETEIRKIEEDPAKKPDHILKILVIGSADTTGIGTENDLLSKERAMSVAGLLGHKFPPETIINFLPKGDAENERKVRVEWKYVPASMIQSPTLTSKTETPVKKYRNFSSLAIFISLALISLFLFHKLVLPKTKHELKEKKTAKNYEVAYQEGDIVYLIPVSIENGVHKLPFHLPDGNRVVRKHRNDAKQAVRHSIKKNPGEFKKLVDEGQIPWQRIN